MVKNVSGLGPVKPLKPKSIADSKKAGLQDKTFKKVLGDFMSKVSDLQLDADESIKKLASGEVKDIHQVMTALAEADISFKMMMTIRSKLVEAYKEVMKMQV